MDDEPAGIELTEEEMREMERQTGEMYRRAKEAVNARPGRYRSKDRRIIRTADLTDAELEIIRRSEMDERHANLDHLMDE
jgi:hypothetical protein